MIALADWLGQEVRDAGGARIGRLLDVAVHLGETYPRVTRLQVRVARNELRSSDWGSVTSLGPAGVEVGARVGELPEWRLADDELLLSRDVLDHQIFDLAGKRLARVGDVELAEDEGYLRAVAVDVGASAIVRRLGLRRLARRIEPQAVDWRDLHLASARGHALQLDTPAAAVHRLQAAELAELVAHLPHELATGLLSATEPAKAAEALEVLAARPRRRRFEVLWFRRHAPS
jgi:sporulation protein YlmC with PRC-barrel domain